MKDVRQFHFVIHGIYTSAAVSYLTLDGLKRQNSDSKIRYNIA